jgi:acylphosphatase
MPGGAPHQRVRVVAHGLVQGVWYRQSCRAVAVELGLSGWVRNRSDGTVEVLVEGPEPDVARLVSWCRHGPPRAEVTALDVTVEAPDDGGLDRLGGFVVR